MRQTSSQLFNAWAAKHKQFVALEDELRAAQREGGTSTNDLAAIVYTTKAEADRMLAEALALFRSELKERGLS